MRRGNRIHVVAPSGVPDSQKLAAGVALLELHGFHVEVAPPPPKSTLPFLHGDDAFRSGSLRRALEADADVVWLARGGYGLARILDVVDYDREPGSLVVGFSDATSLLNLLANDGRWSVHGPLVTTLARETDLSAKATFDCIDGCAGSLVGTTLLSVGTDRSNVVEGISRGGNLCVLSHLIGTPFFPNLDGAVLFLEEIAESPYRIDRMLTQLLQANLLHGVRAIVLGYMTECGPHSVVDAVFVDRLERLSIPVVAGFRFGHETPNFPFPIGRAVRLSQSGDVPLIEWDAAPP